MYSFARPVVRNRAVSVDFGSEATLSEDQIRDHFGHFGGIESVRAVRPTEAEVTFKYFESTARAASNERHIIDNEKLVTVRMLESGFARESEQLQQTVAPSTDPDFSNPKDDSDSDPEDESDLMAEFLQDMEDAKANASECEEVSSDEEEQPKKFIEEDFGYMSDSGDEDDDPLFQTPATYACESKKTERDTVSDEETYSNKKARRSAAV